MKFSRVLPLILATFTLFSCSFNANNDNDLVCLNIIEDAHFDVTSSNPVYVSRGQEASFELTFDDGYFFGSSSLGEYKEGKLIVENAQQNQSIYIETKRNGQYIINVNNDINLGDVEIIPNKAVFDKGEEVTIKVTPKPGEKFLCYTQNYPYRSENIDTPIAIANSYDSEYTFKMTEDINLFTNYYSKDPDSLLINYNLNGGHTNNNKKEINQEYILRKPHFNPQSLMGSYYMFNEGYTLESYNSKPDGSGIRIGIGSKIDISLFSHHEVTLYAIWAKHSNINDFEFKENATGYSVKQYIGNDEVIVIPDTYNNKKVNEILPKAFDTNKVSKLVLHPNIEVVERSAFFRCDNLKEVVMYSNLKQIEHYSFNPNKIETLRLNCNTYTDLRKAAEKDLSYQLETIDHLKGDKRMIFVGTSTLRFNQTMNLMKEAHPEYEYYLYGAVVRTDMGLVLDLLSSHLKENDKVLYMIHDFSNSYRYDDLRNMMFLEYNFDLLSKLNYQDHKNILFKSLVNYNGIAKHGIGQKAIVAEIGCPDVNEYGKVNRINYPTNDRNNVGSGDKYNLSYYCNDRFFKFLLPFVNKLPVKLENKYGLWSSYNRNAVGDIKGFEEFETFIRTMFSNLTFVDSIKDNIFDGINFSYKDNMHMCERDTYIREKHWLEVLNFD